MLNSNTNGDSFHIVQYISVLLGALENNLIRLFVYSTEQ